jgi:cyanophycinase-like exopeptidase
MLRFLLFNAFIAFSACVSAQNFTSWSVGSSTSIDVDPEPGIVLMGGAGEMPEAMVWFLEKANGGDILVLRASGSDAYNDYLFSELGVNVNRVETIRCNNPNCANEPYILERIAEAEAVWIAGGDQHNYVQFWKDTAIEDALHSLVNGRGGAIGGISAGLAILGFGYFAASNGTVYSGAALSNPYNEDMDVRYGDFLRLPFMNNVINDSHYDDPDRKGRHVSFMARLITDHSIPALGIGCNEYTAVCIGQDGFAHCYGEYPQYQEQVYFIRPACLDTDAPVCIPDTPLDWGFEGGAINVFVVNATIQGDRGLDLNDWTTGDGGYWENWWVESGELLTSPMDKAPACPVSSVNQINTPPASSYLASGQSIFAVKSSDGNLMITIPSEGEFMISDMSGRMLNYIGELQRGTHSIHFPIDSSCIIINDINKLLKSAVICQ